MLAVTFQSHYKKLSSEDQKFIFHDPKKLIVSCTCCGNYVRSDNISGHVESNKHAKNREKSIKSNQTQAKLKDVIEKSKLSKNVDSGDHMMR